MLVSSDVKSSPSMQCHWDFRLTYRQWCTDLADLMSLMYDTAQLQLQASCSSSYDVLLSYIVTFEAERMYGTAIG